MYNGIYTIEQYAYMHDTLQKWLSDKIQGSSLGERLLEKGVKKVAIYGVNGLGEKAYSDIRNSEVEVECFIDRKADDLGGKRLGLAVLPLEQLDRVPEDCYILVTPEIYFYDIMRELLDRGGQLEHIISLSMVV